MENPSIIQQLKQAIDDSIKSLGGPISQTINWHMDRRGVFTDPEKIDINNFSTNLEELVGPGAELILEDAADRLERSLKKKVKFEKNVAPVNKIIMIMEAMGGAAQA